MSTTMTLHYAKVEADHNNGTGWLKVETEEGVQLTIFFDRQEQVEALREQLARVVVG